MTIEEAIYCLKTYDPESDYSACFKCPYYGSTKVNDNTYICQSNTARKMAIEALKKESRRRQKMNKIKDVKNEGNMKTGVWLSAPWYTYYHELEALFGQDSDVILDFNEDDLVIRLYVFKEEKAYALSQLLPAVKEFGNVPVRTRVIPANKKYESDYDLLLKAFKDNPIFDHGVAEDMTEINYILFKKEVVQFYNDQFNDPDGYKSTLYQCIADDVFDGVSGVFFSTARNESTVPDFKEEKK